MSDRIKPLALGVTLALLAFLAMNGIDVLPLLLLLGIVVLVMTTGVLGQLSSRTRVGAPVSSSAGAVPPVRFEDVGGQRTAKQELMEALEFLLHPEAIRLLGIRPLKGILFTGPPGTGKTMLAKAAANYTQSAFIAASGSEFIEMYAGVGAQRVRQLFSEARALARRENRHSAIIFIDEIEVMAGRRGQHSSHLEYDQTLNQLLVEMDGINGDDEVPVLLMAATNRADLLDPALLRPGRLDRMVRVDLPDREARLHILKIHVKNKPLGDDVNLDQLARDTYGFSGAHLESLCNEAAILALRARKTTVGHKEFHEAVDKVLLGEKLDREIRREELYRVAVHEGGHALVSELTSPGSVATVTIVPRGMALGFVRQSALEDPLLQTVSELEKEIMVCLAGSQAEHIIFGERSTGASNDFEKAWDIARRMVMAGISELGIVQEDALTPGQWYDTIKAQMTALADRTDALLRQHQAELKALAETLLEIETVEGGRLREWLSA